MNGLCDFSNWLFQKNKMSISDRIMYYEDVLENHIFSENDDEVVSDEE